VWDNLKLIAETMLNRDFELASTLVGACGLRTPHGDLSVVYDGAGALYELPLFAYADPTNLVSDEEAAAAARESARAAGAGAAAAHRGPPAGVDVVLRVSAAAESLEQDVRLGGVRTDTSVGELKERLHAALASGALDAGRRAEPGGGPAATASASPNKWAGRGLPPHRQRVMFRGRELRDEACLQAAGVEPGPDATILQVFLRVA